MGTVELIRGVQALLFLSLALTGARVWARNRSRPAALLAAGFAGLAIVTGLAAVLRRYPTDELTFLRDLNGAIFLSIAWFFAAFARSFTSRRLPPWLWWAALGQLFLIVVLFVLPPIGPVGERTTTDRLVVALAVLSWLTLVATACWRLWRVRGQRVVRARARSMAAGLALLGVAIIWGVAPPPDGGHVLSAVIVLLPILAAALFGIGFAPPAPLRWWWRQLPTELVDRMQTELIRATSPKDVACALTPAAAAVYGGVATFLDRNGVLLARTDPDRPASEVLPPATGPGGSSAQHVRSVDVDGYRLTVRSSAYAPIFGDVEEELLQQFVLQARLALTRTQLQAAHAAAKEELQRAYDSQQAMLIGLAHDLRNPTTIIAGYGGLVRSATTLTEAQSMAAAMGDSVGYLDRLVDGVSELARIGRKDGEIEPISIEQVVGQAARRLAHTHPDITVRTSGDLPTLCVDRLRGEQIVDNLLSNAARHGGRSDLTIEVGAQVGPEVVTLTVSDNGRGIPPEEHDEVFTLFRRGRSATTPGSGIGLGLVRRIVGSYGGSITISPSQRGASFRIDLPASLVADQPDTTTPMPALEEAAPQLTERTAVLDPSEGGKRHGRG